MSRKRNLSLHMWVTKEERELIKAVATLKGVTVTDLIIELAKKEYEKIEYDYQIKEMEVK